MSGFTDYHAHFVYGVDDGAQTREEMYAMLDAAAADGVRHLFATSHSTPGMERFPQEIYDRHLALLCMIFPPVSYICAEKMKKPVQRAGAAYKRAAAALSAATLDRAKNAVTYRIYGCEDAQEARYEAALDGYEQTAVRANVCQAALPPLYLAASNLSVLFILWFGAKNVLGMGWRAWNIAAFTTFLSCFMKTAVKSSKAAKLFNAVQRA